MNRVELKNNVTSLNISILLFAISIFIPAFQFYVPKVIRYMFLFVSVILLGFQVLKDYKLTNDIIMILFECFIFSALVILSRGITNNFFQWIIWFFEFWYSLVISIVVVRTKAYSGSILYYTLLFLLIFTTVTTIIGNQQYPYASRKLASGIVEDGAFLLSKNIGGYGFIYGLVLMVPCILRRSKDITNLFHKILCYAIVGLFLFCVFIAQYMLAILLIIAGIVFHLFSCIKRKSNKLMFATILMIIFLLFILFSEVIAQGLLNLSKKLSEYDSISDRIYSLYELFSGNGFSESSDANSRMDLYVRSIKTMFSYPLIGTFLFNNETLLGGHSDILDSISGTGILGIIMILAIYRKWKGMIVKRSIVNRFYVVAVVFVILALTNTIFSSFQISFIMFLMPILSMRDTRTNEDCRN